MTVSPTARSTIVPPPVIQDARRSPRASSQWAILLASVLVVLLAAGMRVREGQQVALGPVGPLPEICTFKRLTGIGCPGCGLTRCFISLVHGDLKGAWNYNPVGIAVFALISLQIPYRLIIICAPQTARRSLVPRDASLWGMLACSVLLILQWMVRIL